MFPALGPSTKIHFKEEEEDNGAEECFLGSTRLGCVGCLKEEVYQSVLNQDSLLGQPTPNYKSPITITGNQ
jgi:hypothetical protein